MIVKGRFCCQCDFFLEYFPKYGIVITDFQEIDSSKYIEKYVSISYYTEKTKSISDLRMEIPPNRTGVVLDFCESLSISVKEVGILKQVRKGIARPMMELIINPN